MLINEQLSPSLVPNPLSVLPSLSTEEVVQLMRVDKSFGTPRILNALKDAYDVINRQLIPAAFDYAHTHAFIRAYRRAVLHETAALLSDLYADFDTLGQGGIRADGLSLKSDSLRRIVSHAVADLNGRPRNRICLL
ncbi:MAG: head completion/stabilization protein [Moraxella sp.]|nr:head completion/stabilization protein [Moraxella sp.]